MKKNLSKVIALLLLLSVVFSFAGCDQPSSGNPGNNNGSNNQTNGNGTNNDQTTENDQTDGSTDNSHTYYVDVQALNSSNKTLIIESISGESEFLQAMLDEELREKLTVVNSYDTENMPTEVEQLASYDQIILCNVAYKDMPERFDELLHSYVYDYGGGLFTVCGNEPDPDPTDEEWTTNAYTKVDMMGTIYQDLLPVEIINYTPPMAVVVVIDKSGSMADNVIAPNGETAFDYAKLGAEAVIDALSERDFMAVMSFGEDYEDEISLTPLPYRMEILSAIERIQPGGGKTIFTTALERAGNLLSAKTGVEKRHIILITDGQPTESNSEEYLAMARENAERGITMSIFGVDCSGDAANEMKNLIIEGGMSVEDFYNVEEKNIQNLPTIVRSALYDMRFDEVYYQTFRPTFGTTHNITAYINEEDMPYLDGYYGVKAKAEAEVILMGEYSPIYTQWNYGNGKVGTFACDLNGTWSSDFINSPVGAVFINNIMNDISMEQHIVSGGADSVIEGVNSDTALNVSMYFDVGEYVEVSLIPASANGESEGETKTVIGKANKDAKLSFTVSEKGLYEIRAEKKDENGVTLSSFVIQMELGASE